ncbi:MAG: transcriptional regulator [Chitinophagales bacterium]
MQLGEAKQEFIQNWGSLGSQWGINRTMAQIHALLLISPDPLTTEQIMEELQISRGNTSMNVRELINWQLVKKHHLAGERREYFSAEKDIWKVFLHILRERKKRELDPVIRVIHDLQQVNGNEKDRDVKEFKVVLHDINKLVSKGDRAMETIIRSDESWFLNTFLKLLR